jgi:hypothetical protein
MFEPPHAAPTAPTAVWQTPGRSGDAVAQVRSAAHPGAEFEPQAPPDATNGSQMLTTAAVQAHSWLVPQLLVAHESPVAGCGPHVPHVAYRSFAQNPDAHCALNVQGAPVALTPTGAHVGGRLSSRKSAHEIDGA